MLGVPLFGMERFQRELLWIGVPLVLLTNAALLLRAGWSSVRRLAIHGRSPCATHG